MSISLVEYVVKPFEGEGEVILKGEGEVNKYAQARLPMHLRAHAPSRHKCEAIACASQLR